MAQKRVAVPHVLIFPFPAQGHVNSMLKLAELLALAGLNITFLNTDHNHNRLLRYTDAQTRFAQFPGFSLKSITDGLPADHPRSVDHIKELIHSLKTVMEPAFQGMLFSGHFESEGQPPVSCILADGVLSFTIDVAKELGIPSISFRTASACYFWTCFCAPKLIQAGEFPFAENADMDGLITSVPGMEEFIRRRDLPSFCRAKEINDTGIQFFIIQTQNSIRATAHIFNTFEDLEGPILSQIRTHFPKVYSIGPLHAILNVRCTNSSPSSSSNSLLEVDSSCMRWLDSKPSKSVVYVSFGSLITITKEEMLEFWHGLVNCGKHFLWVMRPHIVTDKEADYEVPEELREGTKERGCIVRWCPQEDVLKHEAIGGFFTHSGWNSTLESLVAGVPMVCWPRLGDQQINSRFVSEAWNIGLDMKDKCDRSTVKRMVLDLMEDKREELMKSMDKVAEKARRCVNKGGSSYLNLDMLIEDIKSGKFT